MKTALRFLASLVISGAFLWFAVRGVSWSEVRAVLETTRIAYVVPIVAAIVASVACRAMRWGLFVRPMTPASHRSLLSATAIGFAANMVLPLRAGEVIRPWILTRSEPIRMPEAFATIALERLFDMGTLLLFFVVGLFWLPLPDAWRAAGPVFAGGFAGLVGGLTLLRLAPERVLAILAVVLRPLPDRLADGIARLVRGFAAGLASLGDYRSIVAAVGWSFLTWAMVAVSFGFGFNAMELDVPWAAAAGTVALFVAIAVALPGGPAFIGMFQTGCVLGLGVYGVDSSIAVAYSILTHSGQFVGTVGFGIGFALADGFGLKDVEAASRESVREGEAP